MVCMLEIYTYVYVIFAYDDSKQAHFFQPTQKNIIKILGKKYGNKFHIQNKKKCK